MILPGATLGMLGGGQLGRMFTVAARTMGYKVVVLDPDPESPAGRIADVHLRSGFHDTAALNQLSQSCVAITTEFENVPADTLEILAKTSLVRPSAAAVATTQNRIHEKTFLQQHGIPTNKFCPVRTEHALQSALAQVGLPAILKISSLGYDGKGQWKVHSADEASVAFQSAGGRECLLEEFLPFAAELSVVVVRSADGDVATYPTAENIHRNGILDTTLVPARVGEATRRAAQDAAVRIANHLNYQGVLAVEMFVMPDGRILVNEIAPRPHNSGHYTMDACVTSQFEQQVRVLCGFPPGATTLLSPAVMFNILGDVWAGSEPRWENILSTPNVKLHLYGKSTPRPGRKMGHFTCLGPQVEDALTLGARLKKASFPANSL